VKYNGLIQVFGIASVIKADGESNRKIIQCLGPTCVTDGAQSQHLPVKCNGLIQVVCTTSVIKAGGDLKRKITQ
jgi:hypothetical protein